MKALLTSIALLTTLTIGVPHANAYEPWRDREGRFQYVDGHGGWSPWEVKLTIRWATQRWGVSTSYALYVADRESHFGQYATNAYSGACGPFQHLPRYWPGRIATVASARPLLEPVGTSCYNARSNVLAAIWMARNGWGPWSL